MDLIIGGGITGISYALFSKDRETLILEKENELGGYLMNYIKEKNYESLELDSGVLYRITQ